MNEVKVLGIKKIKFTDEDTGEVVAGTQLWCSCETADAAWLHGEEVFKSWAKAGSDLEADFLSLRPGDVTYVRTDRRGRITGIEV